jgi:hypothetical protein
MKAWRWQEHDNSNKREGKWSLELWCVRRNKMVCDRGKVQNSYSKSVKISFFLQKSLLEEKSEISWTKYASTPKTPLKTKKKLWEKRAGRSQRGLMAFEVQQRCQLQGWLSPWLQEASLSCKANVVIIM